MHTNLNTDSKNNLGITDEIADLSNCSYVFGQTHPQYFKICKSKMLKTTNIESLPDEMIFDILVRVRAQDICNAIRFVCRKWYRIIRTRQFVRAHLQQSTPGLLIQKITSTGDEPILVATRNGTIEISNINYNFRHAVFSSCNGLILERRDKSPYICITNPATKQHFSLPRFVFGTSIHSSSIGYAVASKKYKLVRPFFDGSKSRDEIAILTVGVDNDWMRRVNIQHLYEASTRGPLPLSARPLCTEGFMHWVEGHHSLVREGLYVLTLNIETEIVTQFRVPQRRLGDSSWYYYLSTGRHLTMLIGFAKFFWEVWEMKSETGEWRKTMIIDLESEKLRFKSVGMLMPIGWLNFGEVLVFNVYTRTLPYTNVANKLCIAYNVLTNKITDSFCKPGLNKFAAHIDSLVWLDLDGR